MIDYKTKSLAELESARNDLVRMLQDSKYQEMYPVYRGHLVAIAAAEKFVRKQAPPIDNTVKT